MALKTKQLERVFNYNKKELVDIDSTLSPDQIMDIYSNQYPELVNAKIDGPKVKGNKAIYTFTKSLGTKG